MGLIRVKTGATLIKSVSKIHAEGADKVQILDTDFALFFHDEIFSMKKTNVWTGKQTLFQITIYRITIYRTRITGRINPRKRGEYARVAHTQY